MTQNIRVCKELQVAPLMRIGHLDELYFSDLRLSQPWEQSEASAYCAFSKRSNSIITAVLCTEALLLLTWKLQVQSLNRLALTATTNVLALVVDHY